MNLRRFIRTNIKAIVGYTLFSMAAFILFLYLLFPREAIKARVIYELEKGTATEIKTTSDKWVFPLGLVFNDLVFTQRGGNTSQSLARIDRLGIELPVKSLISFSPITTLSANLYGGSVKGLFTLLSDNKILQMNWVNVDLSRVERLKDVPAELTGKLSGDLVVKLLSNTQEGQIRFIIKNGKLGKINASGFPLPDLPIDELQGTADLKDYTLSLKDVHFKNSDIKGSITGDIQLQSSVGPGNLNISIRFSVGEKMKKDYHGLLSFIERTKDREGYYTIHIKGDIKKPTIGI